MQNFDWLTLPVGAAMGSAATYITRLIFDNKKVRTENDSAQLDVDVKAIDQLERLNLKFEGLMNKLEEKNSQLNEKVDTLRIQNTTIIIENMQLVAENKAYKETIENLKAEVNEIKSNMK